MSVLAESLKRLFSQKEITVNKIKELFASHKITEEEYHYILKNNS